LDDGRPVQWSLFETALAEQHAQLLKGSGPDQQRYVRRAAEILEHITRSERLAPFLTSVAYADLD
jgi:hypothetical protein